MASEIGSRVSFEKPYPDKNELSSLLMRCNSKRSVQSTRVHISPDHAILLRCMSNLEVMIELFTLPANDFERVWGRSCAVGLG